MNVDGDTETQSRRLSSKPQSESKVAALHLVKVGDSSTPISVLAPMSSHCNHRDLAPDQPCSRIKCLTSTKATKENIPPLACRCPSLGNPMGNPTWAFL